jgi:MraZ protein
VTEPAQSPGPLEAPRGVSSGRVDDKGRLKLSAAVRDYLAGLEEKALFVTSLDLRSIRIYPMSVWRDNERLILEESDDPEETEEVWTLAQDLGQQVEMDKEARILLPAELRRMLGLENQPVVMNAYKGRINVYDKETYEELRNRARERAVEKLRKLERKGLK